MAYRFVFLLTVFNVNDYVSFQIIIVCILNLVVLLYIGDQKPFDGRLKNRILMFNVFCLSSITFCLFGLTEW